MGQLLRGDQQVVRRQLHVADGKRQRDAAGLIQFFFGLCAVKGFQLRADLAQLPAVLRPQRFQLRLEGVADKARGGIGVDHVLHVQLVADDVGINGIQLLFRHHGDGGKGLAVLDVGAVAGCAAQHDHLEDLVHGGFQRRVDPRLVDRRVVAQMHRFRRVLIDGADQVAVDILRHKGDHGGGGLGHGDQGGVQRHVGVDLVLGHALRPVALAASAHVPVGKLVHEVLQRLAGLRDAVVGQILIRGFHGGMQAAEHPLVHDGKLVVVQRIFGGVEFVDVGVQHEEGVGVPQGAHELALALLHRLAVEAVGQPRGGVGVEVPADGVRAVGGEGVEGIHGVALGFAHLLAVLVLHQAEDDDVFIGGLVEQQRGDGQQRIEPAAGLVHRLGDEVGGELLFKQVFVFKGIVVLREGHGAGIEPAVDDLRHALHGLAALRAADGHRVDVGAVQLDILRAVVGHLLQLGDAAHAVAAAALALPDVQRRAPVAVAGQAPVLHVLDEIAEAALADAFGDPVDGIVVVHQIVAHGGHLDEPGFAGVVQQGRVAAPAVGIFVLELRRAEQQAAGVQILQELGVCADHALLQLLLAGLGAHAEEGRLRHVTLQVHELHEGQVVPAADSGVVLAEGRGAVHDAGTVGHGDVVVAHHEVGLFMLLFRFRGGAGIQRLVLGVLQILAGTLGKDLVGGNAVLLIRQMAQHRIQQRGGEDVGIAVGGLHFCVFVVGVHAQGGVGQQRPGRGGPRQEVRVLVLFLEADDGGALLHGLVALRHLVGGQRRAAAGAVRDDLETLIQQTLVPDGLQRPPLGFDVVVVIGHVGVVHIGPEADGGGEILPHALVFPHAFLALLDEGSQTVLLDLFLAVQSQQLFHLDLHRQAVGVPAGLAGDHAALHGVVAGDHILDDAGQHVADVRLAVGRGRAVVKHVGRIPLAGGHALFKDLVVLPELFDLLFALHEFQIGGNFLIHNGVSLEM